MTIHPCYFTWNYQPAGDPFPVERAEGDEFVLADGRRVYDFISTSFQTSFGHSNHAIRQSIHRQLDAMPVASPKASFDLKQRVSEGLLERLRLAGGKLFYTVSGSESVENALKMARQLTARTIVLARRKSYHGASLGALSVTGDWRNEPHFTVDQQTVRIPEPHEDPDLNATRQIVAETGPERIAAIILETISGTNGVAIPPPSWLQSMQRLCREHGMLLIIDEVLCGFGRTGPDFAFQDYDLEPDFVCLSKAISGGYIPFGAVWTGPRVVDFYSREKLACGLTSYAHPLGLAALEAVLQLLADAEFRQNKENLQAIFANALDGMASWESVKEVRCRGLLAAIELNRPAPTWEAFFEAGLHVSCSQQMVILAPPFISRPDRLSESLRTLQQVLVD